MATGHDRGHPGPGGGRCDRGRAGARLPADRRRTSEPGSVFAYNNTATYMLGSDRPAGDRPEPDRLPAARGCSTRWASTAALGHLARAAASRLLRLHLSTEDMARFGQLYLRRRRSGRAASCSPQAGYRGHPAARRATPANPTRTGSRATATSSGGPGTATAATAPSASSASCCPSRTPSWSPPAATEDMQAVLDAVWAHLLPAFDQVPSAAADQRLAERLGHPEAAVTQSDGTTLATPDRVRADRSAGRLVAHGDIRGGRSPVNGWRLRRWGNSDRHQSAAEIGSGAGPWSRGAARSTGDRGSGLLDTTPTRFTAELSVRGDARTG